MSTPCDTTATLRAITAAVAARRWEIADARHTAAVRAEIVAVIDSLIAGQWTDADHTAADRIADALIAGDVPRCEVRF